MTDPRERIETEHIKCSFSVAGLWLIESDREDIYPCVPWPELVELAQKILAADEAWKDANVPTFQGLRTKYPGFNFACDRIACGPTYCDVAWVTLPDGTNKENHFESEAAALRWLAATLAEITPVEGREEVGDGK